MEGFLLIDFPFFLKENMEQFLKDFELFPSRDEATEN